MSNKFCLNLFLVCLTAFTIIGCKNDIDVYADYKETAVIYGMLDPNSPIQLIKINKAYQVRGNALDAAKVKDSLIYPASELEIFIDKIENGKTLKSFPFAVNNSVKKDPGIFYNDGNTLYSFETKSELEALNKFEYKIRLKHKRKDGSFYEASAKCNVFKCSQRNFEAPRSASSFGGTLRYDEHKLVDNNSLQYSTSLRVLYKSVEFGKRYAGHLRLYYTEEIKGVLTNKYIDFPIGTKILNDTKSGQMVEFLFNAEDFYNYVGQKISKGGLLENGDKLGRYADSLQYRITVVDDNIDTYMTANNLASGLSQDKPTFTNVSNGLGVFGCRSIGLLTLKSVDTRVASKPNFIYNSNDNSIVSGGMSQSSVDSLARSSLCKHLNFAYYYYAGPDAVYGGIKQKFLVPIK